MPCLNSHCFCERQNLGPGDTTAAGGLEPTKQADLPEAALPVPGCVMWASGRRCIAWDDAQVHLGVDISSAWPMSCSDDRVGETMTSKLNATVTQRPAPDAPARPDIYSRRGPQNSKNAASGSPASMHVYFELGTAR